MLSKNFSLLELTKSQTAERRGISNNPNADHIFNLTALAENIFSMSITELFVILSLSTTRVFCSFATFFE
mgnify:CR=1 FL=1